MYCTLYCTMYNNCSAIFGEFFDATRCQDHSLAFLFELCDLIDRKDLTVAKGCDLVCGLIV